MRGAKGTAQAPSTRFSNSRRASFIGSPPSIFTPSPAPTAAGSGIGGVFLNDARQEIEQNLTLARLERREDAVTGVVVVGKQAMIELLALRRQIEVPSPPVAAAHAPFNQPSLFKFQDDNARIVAIDPKSRRKANLVDAGLAVFFVDIGQRTHLQRGKVCFRYGARNHCDAYLVKPPRQSRRI